MNIHTLPKLMFLCKRSGHKQWRYVNVTVRSTLWKSEMKNNVRVSSELKHVIEKDKLNMLQMETMNRWKYKETESETRTHTEIYCFISCLFQTH